MKTKTLVLTLLTAALLIGCQKTASSQEEEQPTKDAYIINDFESIEQLSLMKFPSPSHHNRGRMELSSEHVTNGNKSLKYYNEYGNEIEMCHYFDHIVENGIDVSNIKTISIDIYNDSDFDTTGALYLCANEDLSTVVNLDFTLTKKEMNHISFPISKVSLDFNKDNIRAVSLKLFTTKTNYNKGIYYTFYLDNWRATMGSEYTETDKQYNIVVENIKNKIDALPATKDITLEHENALKEIADLIADLPDAYRGAIPNLNLYRTNVDAYNAVCVNHQIVNYDRNSYMDLEKFYGISQLKPDNGVKADVIYSNDEWAGKDGDQGSTKVVFFGSQDNRFIHNGNIDLNAFDFVYFIIHNASNNLVRIWFNYLNNIYADIQPHQTTEVSFMTGVFVGQDYWTFDHISLTTNQVVPSSGALYFGNAYATGRSQETLLEQARHAFDTMPDPSSLVTEDDYLKGLTSTATARTLYDSIEDKSQFTDEQINKLSTLENIYKEEHYGVSHNAYDGAVQKFGYGQEFASKNAVKDYDYGFVTTANITKNIPNDDGSRFEQGFYFAGNVSLSEDYNGYAFYVYSPLDHDVKIDIHSSNWDNWGALFDAYTIHPGWNKIDVRKATVLDSPNNQFAIVVGEPASSVGLIGEWKFTSLFGIPRAI